MRLIFLGIALAISAALAQAQSYPAKPIKIVVPFPAGGIAKWAPVVKASGARVD